MYSHLINKRSVLTTESLLERALQRMCLKLKVL